MGKHGGRPPYPLYWEWKSAKWRPRPARTFCVSMRSLAKGLPAARAELADSVFPAFGYEKRRAVGTSWESIYFLPNRLPATRAEMADFAFPAFECGRARAMGRHGGKPPNPHTGNGKVRKSGLARHARSVRACADWRSDFQRRVLF